MHKRIREQTGPANFEVGFGVPLQPQGPSLFIDLPTGAAKNSHLGVILQKCNLLVQTPGEGSVIGVDSGNVTPASQLDTAFQRTSQSKIFFIAHDADTRVANAP